MTSNLVRHRYVSTACLHERHADCRYECKYCPAKCMCACHRVAFMQSEAAAKAALDAPPGAT